MCADAHTFTFIMRNYLILFEIYNFPLLEELENRMAGYMQMISLYKGQFATALQTTTRKNKLIHEKMVITLFTHRQHLIIILSPSTEDIKTSWPALCNESHVSYKLFLGRIVFFFCIIMFHASITVSLIHK